MIIHFIRHGEPDYEHINMTDHISSSNYASLTKKGVQQANNINYDIIKNAKIILASPYTRTMHTAHIVSKNSNLELIIEQQLYEWNPDKTNSLTIEYFYKHNKLYKQDPHFENEYFETHSEIKKRITSVLDKYKNIYDEIVVVAHQRIISTIIDYELDFCEVYTYDYK